MATTIKKVSDYMTLPYLDIPKTEKENCVLESIKILLQSETIYLFY